MQIISRSGWGARSPQSTVYQTDWSKRTAFVVHHSSADPDQTVREIQNFHMDTRGWSDIGYNFLVDQHGRAYEGRGWLGIGAHVAGHNTATVGVCVIGNWTDTRPPTAALATISDLYREAVRRKGRSLSVFGHRDLGSTACPGGDLYGWVRSELAGYRPPTKPNHPPVGTPAPGPFYAWPLPSNRHYFGPASGPATSVSGRYGRVFDGKTDNEWLRLWVEQLQKRGWNARKGGTFLTRYGNDGQYGPEYRQLIRAFQEDQGLDVDGLLGPSTWAAAFTNAVR